MTASTDSPILPIVLGGDVGAYSLGLEFHEAYGVHSICLAASPVDMITRSKIFELRSLPAKASDRELIDSLLEIAAEYPDKRKVVVTTNDNHVLAFAKHADQLAEQFCVPYAGLEAVRQISDKASFYALGEKLGVPVPASTIVDFSDAAQEGWEPPTLDVPFPIVAKPASSAVYNRVYFEGKKKIWFIDDQAQLDDLWEKLVDAGFEGEFIVQQVIPGDDTNIRNLSLYVGRDGEVLMRAAAQVLLEDPSPTLIGNPVAMITGAEPHLWELAEKVLREVGYRGFVNFDVKIDPTDGTPYFLDANPRTGRTSYYIVAGGVNPMVPMVDDLCYQEEVTPVDANRAALFTLVPDGLIKKYVREEALVKKVAQLRKDGQVYDPLRAPVETSLSRQAIAFMQRMNYFPKFREHFRYETEEPALDAQSNERNIERVRVRRVGDTNTWDDLVNDLGGNPFQLWGWGDLKAETGAWEAIRLVVENSEHDVIGGAQVLLRTVPFPFRQVAYVPRGPFGEPSKQTQLADAVASYVGDHFPAVSIIFEPFLDEELPFEPTGGVEIDTTVLLPQTLVIDLEQSEDELLADMRKKTRYDVRKSLRDGLEVVRVESDELLEECLDLYDETGDRADFDLHSRDYYRAVFHGMGDNAPLYAGLVDGEAVGFLWLMASADTALELYGGSNDLGRRARANYGIKWEAMRDQKANGVRNYDMNGLLGEGITTFKGGFAGHTTELHQPVEVPLSPLYPLWAKMLPVVRQWMSKAKDALRAAKRKAAGDEE